MVGFLEFFVGFNYKQELCIFVVFFQDFFSLGLEKVWQIFFVVFLIFRVFFLRVRVISVGIGIFIVKDIFVIRICKEIVVVLVWLFCEDLFGLEYLRVDLSAFFIWGCQRVSLEKQGFQIVVGDVQRGFFFIVCYLGYYRFICRFVYNRFISIYVRGV